MEYVSEITRERVRYRANGYAPSRRRHVAQRQRRRVLHQDRQALRLERSRHLHAARHSGGDVHHLARHTGITRRRTRPTSRTPRSTARRRRRPPARWRCWRRAATRWRRAVVSREPRARRRADGRVVSQGAVLHGRRRQRGIAGRRHTGTRSSPSRIRRASRRASSDRRARCSTIPPTARRRCRCSSR